MRPMRGFGAVTVVAVMAATLGLVTGVPPAASAGAIIHVDRSATGADDGSSWADAFTDLQAGLGAATAGDEIRVAEGVYTPHATDRTVDFRLVDGVEHVGGFPRGGAARPDPDSHPTVLSGDLAGDDQPGGVNRGDNSFHVVGAMLRDGDTVLRGFTVTAGNADGTGGALGDLFSERGAGVFAGAGGPTGVLSLVDSRIVGNTGDTGVAIADPGFVGGTNTFDLVIVNTVIADNDANDGVGAAIQTGRMTRSTTIVNSLIADNAGGGLSFGSGFEPPPTPSVEIVNTTIAGNGGTGGVRGDGETWALSVRNSIVWGNTPAGIAPEGAPTTVAFSDVQGWTGGIGNIDEDPRFAGAGDFRPSLDSPAIDAGRTTAVPADRFDVDGDGDTGEPTPDLDATDRIKGRAVDMGAYEFQTTPPTPATCPSADATVPFTDMDTASMSHRNDIVCIYELGVTTGTSPTSYSPLANVTRQQMASFLARLYESVTGSPAPVAAVPFGDMDTASSSHRDDIARIYGLGITTGTSPTTYSPADNVTRQQMASFLARLYEAATRSPATVVSVPFTDMAAASSSHRNDIARIYGLGITAGTSPTTYSPLANVTRQQMASFLARLYRAAILPPQMVEADDLVGTISVSASELLPGESFTVTLTVTNVADHPVYLEDRADLVYLAARITEEGEETAFGGYVWLGDRVLAPGERHTMSGPVSPIVRGTGTEVEVVAVIAFSLDSFNRAIATGAVVAGVPAVFVPVAGGPAAP